MERWKPIKDYPSYEVSDQGRVRSKERYVEYSTGVMRKYPVKILKQSFLQGYCRVTLYGDGETKKDRQRPRLVHQLVLEAFKKKPKGFKRGQIDSRHFDGDTRNNKLSNLRYGSQKRNTDDKRRHDRIPYGTGTKKAVMTEALVLEMKAKRNAGATYQSLSDEYGFVVHTIYDAVVGRTWRHLLE